MATLARGPATCLAGLTALLLLPALCAAQVPSIRQKQDAQKPFLPGALVPRSAALLPPPGPPPPGPVRNIAEWEESEGILTLWWNEDLIDELQKRTKVYIPVDNAAERASWTQFLTDKGVPMGNVQFLPIPTNSIYTRDYGPWFVRDANDDLCIVNYTCQYGPLDDAFPSVFSALFGIDYYESGLFHVGGNYYPNAYGRAFSSTYVYEENAPELKVIVDAAMEKYLGVQDYHTVAPVGIWHHDTWGKPADPETLLIADFPESDVVRHAKADGMVAFYETLMSPWGRPYEIHRLPMIHVKPPDEYHPYMNSLVNNEQVYVPVSNVPADAIALRAFQEAFEGYEIVPVDAKGCIWYDALHCRTRNFVKRDAIRIYPYPPGDTEETTAPYRFTAEVIPPKGSALLSGQPVLHWTTTGGAPFQTLVLTPTGQPDVYAADIPAALHGTTVSFYLEALDDAGRDAIYPLVAPDGMMSFEVRPDATPPELSRHVPVRGLVAEAWPPAPRVLAVDDMTTPSVHVEYAINGVPQTPVALSREELTYWFEAPLLGGVVPGDLVTYRVVADDGATAPNQEVLPKIGQFYCPVSDSSKVGVVNLCGRPWSAPIVQDALGDLDVPHRVYTRWPADWNEHDVWLVLLGVFPDNYVLSASEAADIVAALGAGKSLYLEGGNTWCDDPQKAELAPLFGVTEQTSSSSLHGPKGIAGTLTEDLAFEYVGETCVMDGIGATGGAELILTSHQGIGRGVLRDTGSYRTIASTFALGGLVDDQWPSTHKELLIRYLEFLGAGDIQLSSATAARSGDVVPIQIESDPADAYVLGASLAEHYLPTSVGTLRLDPAHLTVVAQGIVPASGVAKVSVLIPPAGGLAGLEIHFQALVGEELVAGKSQLTNRDVLSVIE